MTILKPPRSESWRRSALPAAASLVLLIGLSAALAVGFYEAVQLVTTFIGQG